ncbi:MAG: hypothetical protein WC450_09035 [Candidatus Omnitrophota bacterium]
MSTQNALAVNALSFPQIIPQSSEMIHIISLDMAVLKEGQTWQFDDEAVIQYELRDSQGRVMKFLNEERWRPGDSTVSSDDPDHPISGPDSVMLYFQSLDEIQDNLILKVAVSQPDLTSPFELFIPFEEIYILGGVQSRVPQDADIHIVSPLNGSRVSPGQTVPLQIQFAENVNKPDKLLILSPVYSLEDPHVNGQYSLRIEADASPGPYEVLIIGVWNMNHREITASKLLSLKVIDKVPDTSPAICPLSRKR